MKITESFARIAAQLHAAPFDDDPPIYKCSCRDTGFVQVPDVQEFTTIGPVDGTGRQQRGVRLVAGEHVSAVRPCPRCAGPTPRMKAPAVQERKDYE